jgi:hypothetical protein
MKLLENPFTGIVKWWELEGRGRGRTDRRNEVYIREDGRTDMT